MTNDPETRKQRPQLQGAIMLLLAAALAATSAISWSVFLAADDSIIDPPARTIRQDPETLAPGLDALRTKRLSPNHHYIKVWLEPDDMEDWIAHLRNVAAQRGWYVHHAESKKVRLVTPGGDSKVLWNAAADPYGWLEANRDDNAGAKAPELGNYPAYVTVITQSNTGIGMFLVMFFGGVWAAAGSLALWTLGAVKTVQARRR